jgi:hypothetical protein
LYPFQSSVYTIAPGLVAGRTVASTNSAELLRRCPLPICSCEHIEHPATSLAAVVDDRGVGVTAVDVEPLAGAAPGAGEPLGVEQVEERSATPLLVHQVDDREVPGIGSGR